MKYLRNIILCLILSGCAGLQPVNNADLTFNRVVDAPGFTKDQIYDFTKMWVAENFKSAKAVIEYEDKATGAIIGNGSISYPCQGVNCIAKESWKVHFTMRVDIKDDKFRLSFSNLGLWSPGTYGRVGQETPIYMQSDLDAVKPKLLSFGDQILASFSKNKSAAQW